MSKLCLVFGTKFCNEVQGSTSEFQCGVALLFSGSVKVYLLPLWEQSVANFGGQFQHTKHLSCPGASFEPFFEVCQRTTLVNGTSRKEGYMATSGYTNDFVVIEEL